jgi:hypothetical protein
MSITRERAVVVLVDWINSQYEGTAEAQTLVNMAFFRCLPAQWRDGVPSQGRGPRPRAQGRRFQRGGRRLRIVWAGKVDEIHFYHIGVRRFAPGTAVVSFRPGDIMRFKDTIDRVKWTCPLLSSFSARPAENRKERTDSCPEK